MKCGNCAANTWLKKDEQSHRLQLKIVQHACAIVDDGSSIRHQYYMFLTQCVLDAVLVCWFGWFVVLHVTAT